MGNKNIGNNRKIMSKNQAKERLGESNINNNGYSMTIIEYVSATNIVVQFNDKYSANVRGVEYAAFKDGRVKNPYRKSVLNIGYAGVGKHKSRDSNSKKTRAYNVWRGMLGRCYDKNVQKKHMSYIGCTVCDEWHNYQNFSEWFCNNYYEIENEEVEIDKDILIKGNKVYSPETCIFAPKKLNDIIISHLSRRGELPIGVQYTYNKKKFKVSYSDSGDVIHFGSYITIKEAFNVYKTEKEKFIKEVADRYKNRIPELLYNAMYRYKIEITD